MKILQELNPIKGRIPNNLYKDILDNLPLACVDVVLYRLKDTKNPDILMVHRLEEPAKDMFWFPGGRIMKNIGLIDVIKEHLQRECGLSEDAYFIEKQIGAFDYSSKTGIFPELKEGFHALCTCYLIRLKNPNHLILLDKTSKSYKWINISGFKEATLHQYIAEVLNASGLFKQKFDNIASI